MTDQESNDGVLRRYLKNEDSVVRAFRELCAGIEAHNSTLVMVHAAGPGSSELSRKVRFKAVYLEQKNNAQRSAADTTEHTKTHTLTVPASMIQEKLGHLYVPRWFLLKQLSKWYKKSAPVRIAGSWDGEDRLWSAVFKPMLEEIERLQLASEESEQRQQLETDQQQDSDKTTTPVKNIKNQVVKTSVKARRKPQAALLTLQVPTVEWDGWVDLKTQWGKQKVKKTFSAENCVLRFSKSRIYIELPDGKVLIKLASNVRYESPQNL
ncbi:hypothetical protein [Pseudomonas peli]|uniref:hypothetical protein n=1 Tax=Pseudomonas peli TaxID=592361 RepID=UPI00115FBE7E|nr:hypothetical protein [Pseudomonas peli]NMZ70101.1 hypothetical protein [Pseudomonas peli]